MRLRRVFFYGLSFLDCARFQGYLSEAKESDRLLMAKMDGPEMKTLLDDVSMQREGLDLLMPDPGTMFVKCLLYTML